MLLGSVVAAGTGVPFSLVMGKQPPVSQEGPKPLGRACGTW